MLTSLLAFVIALGINPTHLTATVPGLYYEEVQTSYDTSTDTTYGVFARYDVVDDGNPPQVKTIQVRTLPGDRTKADLIAAAGPVDNGITFIK